MENAGKLARQASEFEEQCQWSDAARLHRQAAQAYRAVSGYDFDPVATLTLSSLVNKHMRWAEYCERENEHPSIDTADSDRQSLATNTPASPAGTGSPPATELSPGEEARQRHDAEEQDFEDFWQYMQNWLANPTAFTRPVKPPGSRGAGSGNYQAAASRSVMESFYLVGANPDQTASVYASVAGSPKGMSPLPALAEDDEEAESQPAAHSGSQADSAHVLEVNKALLAENQKLRDIVGALQDRIALLESAAQENNMLKSSILNFREEFHKHANAVSLPRIHEHSPIARRMMATHQSPPAAEVQIRQLEAQLQSMQLENSKQKAQMEKYRERWDRLKESAKRKRQQQLEQQQQQRRQNS